MNDDRDDSADALLASINRRLDAISRRQHELALEREELRLQATRLRLGVPAREVRAALLSRGVPVPAPAPEPRTVAAQAAA
jgi:hypothetical protein